MEGSDDVAMSRPAPALCDGCMTGASSFCAKLTSGLLDEIAREGRIVRLESDELPVAGDTALVLRRGLVKLIHTLIDGRQQIVDFLLPGDVLFSTPSELRGLRVVVASSGAEACALPTGRLFDISASAPDARASIAETLLGEINRKNHQILMLGRKRSEERVATFLLGLAEKLTRSGARQPSFLLPVSRADIADYLSLTTETVSRVFSVLREADMIRLPRPNHVVICDPAGLARVAAGGAQLTVK